MIGARYLADQILPACQQRRGVGVAQNVVCTDIGGTSFDIALITDGEFNIKQIPDVGRFLLNLPLVQVDSIGASTGSFVRIGPNSGSAWSWVDSAGAKIGVHGSKAASERPRSPT